MFNVFAAMLLAPAQLPEIDRGALERQARIEAVRPRVTPAAGRPGLLDLEGMTTVCRAAGEQRDPAAFLAALTRAYALSAAEGVALRGSCAAYMAGRADARR